jgi:hypothetical protein
MGWHGRMTVNPKAWHTLVCCVILLVRTASEALAQQPIRPVPLTPFGDGQESVLMEDLSYRIGTTSYVIVVPAGFVTDFARPRAIWSVLPPTGRYQQAAIVHDFLYWDQGCSREQADALLRAVRSFGSAAWTANARAKADGHSRIIPQSGLPIPALVTWPEYQRKLSGNGVGADSAPTSPPAYCAAAGLVNLDTP